jgi:hypothetical protein
MNSYQEKQIQETIERSLEGIKREAKRREETQRERDAENAASQLRQWNLAQKNLREARGYAADAQKVVDKWNRAAQQASLVLDSLTAEGFVPPAPVVKPTSAITSQVVAQPKPAEPALESETYVSRAYEPCPVCTHPVPPGIAWHKIEDMPDIICVIDAKRALMSGVPAIKIQNALQRQAVAVQNKESQ